MRALGLLLLLSTAGCDNTATVAVEVTSAFEIIANSLEANAEIGGTGRHYHFAEQDFFHIPPRVSFAIAVGEEFLPGRLTVEVSALDGNGVSFATTAGSANLDKGTSATMELTLGLAFADFASLTDLAQSPDALDVPDQSTPLDFSGTDF